MNPQNVLAVGIRILGLVFLYHGLMAIPRFVVLVARSFSGFQFDPLLSGLLAVAWPLALACWFLCGAPQLQRCIESGCSKGKASNSSGGNDPQT